MPVDLFSCDDMERLAALVADQWRAEAGRDWSVPAAGLEWSCLATADHAVDTVLAPAVFLAGSCTDGYPPFDWGPLTLGERATPTLLADGLEAAARILNAVVRDAPPHARAAIWLSPVVEVRGPADFVPRGALELVLHSHDVAAGLGVEFTPPADLCARLRSHVADWPFWTTIDGWTPLTMTGDAWPDLLRASGRAG